MLYVACILISDQPGGFASVPCPRTSAVREAVVSRGALAAPSANHVRPACTLSSVRIAGRQCGTRFVTVAGEGSIVIGCNQRVGGASAEL